MAQIKLLSIKKNQEDSYFYENHIENKVSRALDSNRNEVVEVQESEKAPEISKKARQEERKFKKEQKLIKNESKKREKEMKKSLKKSRKEVVGSADTGRPSGRTDIKANGDVMNPSFQVEMDVKEVAKNDESGNEHEENKKENEESLGLHGVTKREHEEASSQHESISNEHEERSSGHELSIKKLGKSAHEHVELSGHATTSEEHGNSSQSYATTSEEHASTDNSTQMTLAVEETITAQGAHHSEEAPPELLPQPKVIPGIPEYTGGQHVEIEISEVTDLDVDVSSPDATVNVGYSPQTSTLQNGVVTEGPITVSSVQHVERGVDLDGFFAECYETGINSEKEEKRKSVRFQEETEEIASCEVGTKEHEYASVNLGGDFSGTSETNDVESRQSLEPAVEIVSKEERGNVESCNVDLDEVFASSERAPNDNEKRPNNHDEWQSETQHDSVEVEEVKVNGRANVNGNTKVGNGRTTKTSGFVDISLNETNEDENAVTKKKEKRKRSGLVRCCFP